MRPLSLALTRREAKYIMEHITRSRGSRNSLMAYLLLHNVKIDKDFDNLGRLWEELPHDFDKHMKDYRMARSFAHFSYVIRLRFNHIMATYNGQTDEAHALQEEIEKVMQQYPHDFTTQAVDTVLIHISDYVNEPTIKNFCRQAAMLVEQGLWDELDELIVAREKAVKPGRHKLRNPKYMGAERSRPGIYTFRWGEIVYQVINEIRDAL